MLWSVQVIPCLYTYCNDKRSINVLIMFTPVYHYWLEDKCIIDILSKCKSDTVWCLNDNAKASWFNWEQYNDSNGFLKQLNYSGLVVWTVYTNVTEENDILIKWWRIITYRRVKASVKVTLYQRYRPKHGSRYTWANKSRIWGPIRPDSCVLHCFLLSLVQL